MPNENAADPTNEVLWKRLNWDADVLLKMKAIAIDSLAPGSRAAFHGTLERASFLYAAQIGEPDETGKGLVTQLWPERGHMLEPAGTSVRVPAEGTWLAPSPGALLRIVASDAPLSLAELAKALGGREPPPGTSTTNNA